MVAHVHNWNGAMKEEEEEAHKMRGRKGRDGCECTVGFDKRSTKWQSPCCLYCGRHRPADQSVKCTTLVINIIEYGRRLKQRI